MPRRHLGPAEKAMQATEAHGLLIQEETVEMGSVSRKAKWGLERVNRPSAGGWG